MGPVERRVAAWVDLTGDLILQARIAFPHQLLSARLHETFGCQVSWNWMDPGRSMGFLLHFPIPDWPSPELRRDLVAAVAQHPVLRWYGVAGDMAAMSIGRVPRALVTDQGRAFVRDHLVPIGMHQQMSVPYRLGSQHYRTFILARGGTDFSEEDLQVARQLQPLLRLLDRQCAVLGQGRAASGPDAGLTGRELAALRLLADGLTAYSIGRRLGVSPRTVHRHLQGVYRKLGVSDRVRAVVVAREAGLIPEGAGSPCGAVAPSPVVASDVTPGSGVVVGDTVPLS